MYDANNMKYLQVSVFTEKSPLLLESVLPPCLRKELDGFVFPYINGRADYSLISFSVVVLTLCPLLIIKMAPEVAYLLSLSCFNEEMISIIYTLVNRYDDGETVHGDKVKAREG